MEKMIITKMFDVLTPETSTRKSVGYDFFVPRITEDFLNAFMSKPNDFHRVDFERNDNNREFITEKKVVLFMRKDIVDQFHKLLNHYKLMKKQGTCPAADNALQRLQIFIDCHVDLKVFPNRKTRQIEIYKPLTLPTGIMIDMTSDVWMSMLPKSSNLHNGYHVITGTVDEDYTFGVGVQLEPTGKMFTLSVDQKVAQSVFFNKSVNVEFELVDITSFEKLPSVQNKREQRVGGFGSTGLIHNN